MVNFRYNLVINSLGDMSFLKSQSVNHEDNGPARVDFTFMGLQHGTPYEIFIACVIGMDECPGEPHTLTATTLLCEGDVYFHFYLLKMYHTITNFPFTTA